MSTSVAVLDQLIQLCHRPPSVTYITALGDCFVNSTEREELAECKQNRELAQNLTHKKTTSIKRNFLINWLKCRNLEPQSCTVLWVVIAFAWVSGTGLVQWVQQTFVESWQAWHWLQCDNLYCTFSFDGIFMVCIYNCWLAWPREEHMLLTRSLWNMFANQHMRCKTEVDERGKLTASMSIQNV